MSKVFAEADTACGPMKGTMIATKVGNSVQMPGSAAVPGVAAVSAVAAVPGSVAVSRAADVEWPGVTLYAAGVMAELTHVASMLESSGY